MSILSIRIKERRDTMGLTLLEIAHKLGVQEATVQRYECGKIRNVKIDTIAGLAEILDCSPEYLVGWVDQIKRPRAKDKH